MVPDRTAGGAPPFSMRRTVRLDVLEGGPVECVAARSRHGVRHDVLRYGADKSVHFFDCLVSLLNSLAACFTSPPSRQLFAFIVLRGLSEFQSIL